MTVKHDIARALSISALAVIFKDCCCSSKPAEALPAQVNPSADSNKIALEQQKEYSMLSAEQTGQYLIDGDILLDRYVSHAPFNTFTPMAAHMGCQQHVLLGRWQPIWPAREQFLAFKTTTGTSFRQKRQVSRWATRWNNNIFYYFDASVDDKVKKIVKKALNYISARTCINFYEDSMANNRIRVQSGKICSSYVGMQGGVQDLSLNKACHTVGNVIHEIMHALGIWHMQMRNDRDDYIRVDFSSVPKEKEVNYGKFDRNRVINYTPYDYGSVMHYDAKAFATNGNSLIPISARYLRTIGSKIPSFYDIMMINAHYNCAARCFSTRKAQCANSGMPNPRNCAVCLCPSGYGSAFCNERPTGCGRTLMASRSWRSETFTFGGSAIEVDNGMYRTCNHWVKAPQGKLIQIRVTALPPNSCDNGCTWNAIEPKVLRDKRATNPRYCCGEQLNEALTSKLNLTPIFSYSRIATSAFTFQYRYF